MSKRDVYQRKKDLENVFFFCTCGNVSKWGPFHREKGLFTRKRVLNRNGHLSTKSVFVNIFSTFGEQLLQRLFHRLRKNRIDKPKWVLFFNDATGDQEDKIFKILARRVSSGCRYLADLLKAVKGVFFCDFRLLKGILKGINHYL